ncbi:calcium-translocating P-type ATPase, PMCA-type [Anaerotignum sp. MB30-C6]|uniref:calcium-translocating P-type ATPase, PMCA-type n=1 Tax=Anaerotignum sp. MB30-C6 TaxID=3070814 RepID=UPI0027DE7B32|nr:calcium-translocating P-type ATPase, PMCA-type [Anaerotignum sp. MB30-C6]WMI80821.1 calcium-translocating P-type ATPase, PMCA-type [Anaerotignum sp. MB30-C6]
MDWWNQESKEVGQSLGTSLENGLSIEEGRKRLAEKGKNILQHEGTDSGIIRRFFAQFNDFMVMLLIAAAVISFGVSYLNGEKDFIDSIIIIAIVVLNALLGVIQESKAQKALEALKKMSAPKAVVLRSGKRAEIPSEDVVVGDIMLLETGGYICADGRVIESRGLKTEESAITGESLAVEKETKNFSKETALGDRKNMVLSGSFVLGGSGRAIATATGMNTEIGRIANLLAEQDDQETPLQKKLGQTGKTLGMGALAICAIIFVMGIMRQEQPFNMFMTSVSLAVAAIPEGLPAIVTIVLAIGMQRMSKKNTIIRRLPAVETLGSAAVICSDKTGTLTQNKMKVVKISDYGKQRDEEKRQLILTLFALCNDCRREKEKLVGDPTERALAEAAEEGGIKLEDVQKEMPREGEIPFSSERKMMTTLHSMGDGTWMTVTKGAPDILFDCCSKCLEGHRQVAFDGSKKSKARMQNGEMAAGALRVVAVAFREWKEKPDLRKKDTVERDMVFVGMAGMIDPPRPEAANAVALCKKAGVRPVMITGDHVLTAQAIATQLGIYQKGDTCITGQELSAMSDKDLYSAVSHCTVFARVAPEHKVRIVKAYQQDGSVVAMTGDGVNDAPALKVADIGCAMGKSGTEVAKGAADMILTDDNFATIVEAVKEGRGIYDNIRKAVHFLLSSNIGEIITIFAAMCFGWATPLLPIHLLWVNLVTDSLPAIALGLDPVEEDCMERPPRERESTLFGGGLGSKIMVEGMMIGMLALLAFAIGHIYFDQEKMYVTGRTMAFAVLSLSQLVHSFNMRSEHSLFAIHPFENRWLVGALILGTLLQVGVIMVQPLATVFKVAPLDTTEWLVVVALALMPLPIVELEKWKDRLLDRKGEGKELVS